jgi:hypothetical protein
MEVGGDSVDIWTTGGDAMTPRSLGLVVALAGICFLLPATALAQYQGGLYMGRSDNPVGPTVSPYLNLTQNNIGSPTNYQSLVKPLIDQGNAIQRQGNSINRLQQQVYSGAGGGGGRGTGHATFFMNYSHFYPRTR